MKRTRRSYDVAFKTKVVMESMQRDTTIERVRIKYNVSISVINRWRKQFKQNVHLAFEKPHKKKKNQITEQESPEYSKRILAKALNISRSAMYYDSTL